MDDRACTYRFTLTINVEGGHPAYDNPESVGDAAWGALSNEYELRTTCSDIERIEPTLVL